MDRNYRLTLLILLGLMLAAMPLHAIAADNTAQPATSLLASNDREVRLLANIAVIMTCGLIIVGGLLVFFFRGQAAQELWGAIPVQTLGTIFFFPTLILLAVYLELPKDAITTILGAFLGYLFGRSGGGTSNSAQAGDISPAVQTGPVLRPSSGAERRAPEDEPAGTPARAEAAIPRAEAA